MSNYPEVRIISLWQPWASLIALGLKQYETRSWAAKYRGLLAIHAAKRPIDDLGWKLTYEADMLSGREIKGSQVQKYGCIVAIANLTQCPQMVHLPAVNPPWLQISISHRSLSRLTDLELLTGDWSEGRFAWRLEEVISCLDNPIPYKGGQGLRSMPPDDVERLIRPRIMRALEVQP